MLPAPFLGLGDHADAVYAGGYSALESNNDGQCILKLHTLEAVKNK